MDKIIAAETRKTLLTVNQILNENLNRVLSNGILDEKASREFKAHIQDSIEGIQTAAAYLPSTEGGKQ